MASKWVRPEVYPLFAATGVAIGICAFSLLRNITGNPEVRVSKMGRAAGVLENHEEGRRYAEHGLRAYVQDKTPEIMPGINKFFAMYELFAMYREWQEEMAKDISGRQEDFDEFSDVEDLYSTLPMENVEALEDMVSLAPSSLIKATVSTISQGTSQDQAEETTSIESNPEPVPNITY